MRTSAPRPRKREARNVPSAPPPTMPTEACSCPFVDMSWRRSLHFVRLDPQGSPRFAPTHPLSPRLSHMLARVTSCATQGIHGLFVEVEADLGTGLPTFSIVGLPDAAVRESRERVLAAFRNCGFEFPARKITVNLAPAHVRKEGARFDLPIAVALLIASGQIPRGAPFEDGIFVGELALDGTLRGVRGILAVMAAAKREGRGPVWMPRENAPEAAAIGGIPCRTLGSLRELRGDDAAEDGGGRAWNAPVKPGYDAGTDAAGAAQPDLAEVRGQ